MVKVIIFVLFSVWYVLLAHLFSFLCCAVFFVCFVCLHPVPCESNVTSFSRLSIFDCPLGFFSNVYLTE
jgi:hypothetical protein